MTMGITGTGTGTGTLKQTLLTLAGYALLLLRSSDILPDRFLRLHLAFRGGLARCSALLVLPTSLIAAQAQRHGADCWDTTP